MTNNLNLHKQSCNALKLKYGSVFPLRLSNSGAKNKANIKPLVIQENQLSSTNKYYNPILLDGISEVVLLNLLSEKL